MDLMTKIFRFVWPPAHDSTAEELHAWRQGISMATLILLATTVGHLFLAEGSFPQFHPGYATNEHVERWRQARLQDLRVDILEQHVKYCHARGALAASYNQNLNGLRTEYQNLGGAKLTLPECSQVRGGDHNEPE